MVQMWDSIPERSVIDRTINSLVSNNIAAELLDDFTLAKARILSMIPANTSVLTEGSATLNELGISQHIDNSPDYKSFRNEIFGISDIAHRLQTRRQMVNPDVVIGSAQAITESGHIYFASKSGSQIPPYAYSAKKVMLVVGTHKIVSSDDDAMRRIYERCVPMENARAQEAYGFGTSFNKLFVIMKEDLPDRTRVVFINRAIGF